MPSMSYSNELIRKIDDKFNLLPVYAPSTISAGLFFSFPILLSPIGYIIWGCQTNWVTVSGFVIDVFGAVILAVPDLPKYSEWAYGGRVRKAHLRLMNSEKPGRFAPNTRYYDSFVEALREKLLSRDVPENGYFDIKQKGIDYVIIIKNEDLDPIGAGPISIGNIERVLMEVYQSEEGKFRRLGLLLIITGFMTQLLSMIFNDFIIIDLCDF